MCTLMCLTERFITANAPAVWNQVIWDSRYNPHGLALELIGESPLFLQTFDVCVIESLIESVPFDRLVLHQRYATTNNYELVDCHGFVNKRGVRWYHNGCIRNADDFRVDSQNLLAYSSVKDALEEYGQEYANLICTHPEGRIEVGASRYGQLHRDKKCQNFSTVPFADVNIKMSEGEFYVFDTRRG